MLIGRKSDLCEVRDVESGNYSLSVNFFNRDSGFSWCLSCIYGPSTNRGKEEFWIELNDLGNLIEGDWCIGADFN